MVGWRQKLFLFGAFINYVDRKEGGIDQKHPGQGECQIGQRQVVVVFGLIKITIAMHEPHE